MLSNLLLPILAVLAGFALLVWGADRFVVGAASTARNLGVSTLIIGLTVVGFGTSAPEVLVSAMASWQGNSGLAIGNALGSNIANIGLILGATAIVAPLTVRSETLRREFPILLAVVLFVGVLLADGNLNRVDGLLLLGGLGLMLYWLTVLGMRMRRGDPMTQEIAAEIPPEQSLIRSLTWLAVGLVVLLASSRMLVWGAVEIAESLGVSDLVIGLTIVAIGTSLPELAAAIMSALKKEHDIAIGNVIGSNMFNMLAVLPLPGVIRPGTLPDDVLVRDLPVMTILTLALFAMAYGFGNDGRINRVEGVTMLTAFIGYQALLYWQV
ncbi:MAG: calcium/sodium antiporter [Gammaproteobacteria bacterium]